MLRRFYVKYVRKYVENLRKIKCIDYLALYLKTYLYQKEKLIKLHVMYGLDFCKKFQFPIHIIEEMQERSVYTARCFEKREEEQEISVNTLSIYYTYMKKVFVSGQTDMVWRDKTAVLDLLAVDKKGRTNYQLPPHSRVEGKSVLLQYKWKGEKIPKGIFLLGSAPYNYYHFAVEILSRLEYINQSVDQKVPLLIDEIVQEYPTMMSLLDKVNYRHRPIVWIKKGYIYEVEELLYTSINVWYPIDIKGRMPYEAADFAIAESALKHIRECVLSDKNREGIEKRKIYISRRHNDKSRLQNEEKIEALFKKYGFELIYPEKMTFEEQVETFQEASCVAGISGAAFTNILFCNRKTRVICILPEEYQFFLYSTMAKQLDLEFVFLDAKIMVKRETSARDEFWLDESYCEKFLAQLE